MGLAKRVLTLLLAVMLAVPAFNISAAAAAKSGTKMNLNQTSKSSTDYYLIYSYKKKMVYDGKWHYPKPITVTLVTLKNGKVVSRQTLKEGTDYVLETGKGKKHKGQHKIVANQVTRLHGKGAFVDSFHDLKFKYVKAQPKFKTKVSKKTYKVKAVKKKKKTFTIGTTLTKPTKKYVKASKVKYSVKSTPKKLRKYITVNKKGKVTLKKGAKKGTYKVTVTIKATKNYKKAQKTIKIVVK